MNRLISYTQYDLLPTNYICGRERKTEWRRCFREQSCGRCHCTHVC